MKKILVTVNDENELITYDVKEKDLEIICNCLEAHGEVLGEIIREGNKDGYRSVKDLKEELEDIDKLLVIFGNMG